jgi:hemerythrin-like domain-containing protein
VTANTELCRAIFQNEGVKPTLRSIEMLRAEHVNAVRACAEGEAMARSLLRSEKVPAEALSILTRFFGEYVGERHGRKERDMLFPIIERRHGPEVLSLSLRDHEEGCWWIRCLQQIAEAYNNGCVEAGKRWAQTCLSYSTMLTSQIEGEERSLYPLAEAALTRGEDLALREAFEETDRQADERIGCGARKSEAA